MRDRHAVDVGLAITTRTGEFLVAQDDPEGVASLPSRPLDNGESHLSVARKLLHGTTGLKDGEWVLLRPVGLFDGEDSLVMLYAATLPERVMVADGFLWASFQAISRDTHLAFYFAKASNLSTTAG